MTNEQLIDLYNNNKDVIAMSIYTNDFVKLSLSDVVKLVQLIQSGQIS